MLVGLRLHRRLARSVVADVRKRLLLRSLSAQAGAESSGAGAEDAAEVVSLEATFASQILQQTGSNLTTPRRRRARPLNIDSDLILYKSTVDIQDVVSSARRNCFLGSGLAVVGFGVLITSIAPAAPPAVCFTMLAGALANSYALSVIAQRVMRNLAARHVERLVLLPTPDLEPSQAMREGAGLHELSTAATAEENLEVTSELRLEIRTACADHWVTLVEPLEDDELEAQPDNARRASFAYLCQRLRLLHIDPNNATLCPDAALLEALVASPKVIAEERREARAGAEVASALRVAEGAPAPGPMLSDLTVADVEEGHRTVSMYPPADDIDKIGRRARSGGLAILLTGLLFSVGESARDKDGVPRWTNLNLKL